MKVEQERNGNTVTFRINEELTSLNAFELNDMVEEAVDDSVKKVIFDVTNMPYTSSAGLRVILSAHYMMDDLDGEMEMTGVNEEVKEILENTGFVTFINFTTAK